QDLRRHDAERASHSNLDGADRDSAPSLPAAPLHFPLVRVEPGGASAHEFVRPPRSVGLDQRALRITARNSRTPPSSPCPGLIRRAKLDADHPFQTSRTGRIDAPSTQSGANLDSSVIDVTTDESRVDLVASGFDGGVHFGSSSNRTWLRCG